MVRLGSIPGRLESYVAGGDKVEGLYGGTVVALLFVSGDSTCASQSKATIHRIRQIDVQRAGMRYGCCAVCRSTRFLGLSVVDRREP